MWAWKPTLGVAEFVFVQARDGVLTLRNRGIEQQGVARMEAEAAWVESNGDAAGFVFDPETMIQKISRNDDPFELHFGAIGKL